jgi:hypothetical protein
MIIILLGINNNSNNNIIGTKIKDINTLNMEFNNINNPSRININNLKQQ